MVAVDRLTTSWQLRQKLKIFIFLSPQPVSQFRVALNLLLKLGHNASAMLLFLGVFADDGSYDVLPPVDGHSKPKGYVTVQFVLHS